MTVGKRKEAGRKGSVLERLKAEEARDVLRRLLTAHPDLLVEAETIARSLLEDVSLETVADEVAEAICAFDLDDLNERAGSHAWGYVEPSEAAWEILEDAVEPFVADMKRRMELGLDAEALEICKGVVLGLHRIEQSQEGELAQWVSDFTAETAATAIETWHTRRPTGARRCRNRPAFPEEFVDHFVPEWRRMIARISSRRR